VILPPCPRRRFCRSEGFVDFLPVLLYTNNKGGDVIEKAEDLFGNNHVQPYGGT